MKGQALRCVRPLSGLVQRRIELVRPLRLQANLLQRDALHRADLGTRAAPDALVLIDVEKVVVAAALGALVTADAPLLIVLAVPRPSRCSSQPA